MYAAEIVVVLSVVCIALASAPDIMRNRGFKLCAVGAHCARNLRSPAVRLCSAAHLIARSWVLHKEV